MNVLSTLDDIERYVGAAETIVPHDQTVLNTKLFNPRIRLEAVMERHEKEKTDLLAKLAKKTRECQLNQKLIKEAV